MCTRSCKHIKLTRFAGKCGERQRAHVRSSSSSAHPASTVLRFPKGSFGSSEPLFLLDGYDTEKKLSKQESQGQQRFFNTFFARVGFFQQTRKLLASTGVSTFFGEVRWLELGCFFLVRQGGLLREFVSRL